ncbi:hypothetical protein BGZ47_011651 [Haplosporangium gracile]|nr:hypothetical protein BGZ47_011651 [Haplosporangium gracile]
MNIQGDGLSDTQEIVSNAFEDLVEQLGSVNLENDDTEDEDSLHTSRTGKKGTSSLSGWGLSRQGSRTSTVIPSKFKQDSKPETFTVAIAKASGLRWNRMQSKQMKLSSESGKVE